MAMPERICAYRAHAQHREIHNQRLIKSPPRPDYQQIVLVGVMILATTVMVSGFVPVASVGIDPIIELAFLTSGWVSLNWIN